MSEELDHVFERITLRRAEILRELADGRTERETAAKLGLSVNGVRSHVEDLRVITGLANAREVGRWWRNVGACRWIRFCQQAAGAREITWPQDQSESK